MNGPVNSAKSNFALLFIRIVAIQLDDTKKILTAKTRSQAPAHNSTTRF